MPEEVKVTKELLAQIEWLHRALMRMGKGFDKQNVGEYLGRTTEFMKGILWERERQQTMATTNISTPPQKEP